MKHHHRITYMPWEEYAAATTNKDAEQQKIRRKESLNRGEEQNTNK